MSEATTRIKQRISSLAVECGIICDPVSDEGLLGDQYYVELLREAELRMLRMSVRYERLRAAAIGVAGCYAGVPELHRPEAVQDLNAALGGE